MPPVEPLRHNRLCRPPRFFRTNVNGVVVCMRCEIISEAWHDGHENGMQEKAPEPATVPLVDFDHHKAKREFEEILDDQHVEVTPNQREFMLGLMVGTVAKYRRAKPRV